MTKFTDILTSIDTGTSVGVNYKGYRRYTTCPGAVLSLLLYAVVIAYGVFLTIELMNGNSLQVNQYKVFEDRNATVSVSELNGHFGFGLVDRYTGEYYQLLDPELDRLASLEVRGMHSNGMLSEPMQLEYCTSDSFGSATGFEAFENLVCLKGLDELELQIGQGGLLMRMLDCDSTAVESCATLSERQRFFDAYAFSIVAS